MLNEYIDCLTSAWARWQKRLVFIAFLVGVFHAGGASAQNLITLGNLYGNSTQTLTLAPGTYSYSFSITTGNPISLGAGPRAPTGIENCYYPNLVAGNPVCGVKITDSGTGTVLALTNVPNIGAAALSAGGTYHSPTYTFSVSATTTVAYMAGGFYYSGIGSSGRIDPTWTTNLTLAYTGPPPLPAPTFSLQKALGGTGRIDPTDQFRLRIRQAGVNQVTGNTTGSGTAVTSAPITFTGTAGLPYVLDEVIVPGSASALTAYSRTASCSNTGPTDVSGISTVPINITPVGGDAIACTIVNTPPAAPIPQTWWDGDAGPINNGVVNGGAGTWENANNRWSDSTGAINGIWDTSGQVAHFAGTAATVNVSGTQNISGLEFYTAGYTLTGGVLNGVASTNTINVTSSYAASPPVEIIDSVLASSGGGYRFTHDGVGSEHLLALSRDNTYTGPTEIVCGGSAAKTAQLQLGVTGGSTGDIASTSALIGGPTGVGCVASLRIVRSGTINMNYPISGQLHLWFYNDGTVNLNQTNTHGGVHQIYGPGVWGGGGVSVVNANANDALGRGPALEVYYGSRLNIAAGVTQTASYLFAGNSGTLVTLAAGSTLRYAPGTDSPSAEAYIYEATLTGTGTLDWSANTGFPVDIYPGGIVSPGDGGSSGVGVVGTLNVAVAASRKVNFDGILAIDLAAPGTNDKLAVTGDIDLSGGTSQLTLNTLSGYNPLGTYVLVTYTGTRTGTFSSNNLAAIAYQGSIVYDDANKRILLQPAALSTLTKAFAPTSIAVGGISTLTFTITNSTGNPAQSGLAFTDTLPAGLRVAATPNASTTCGAGAVTATAGGSSIALAGGSMASGTAACTVKVDVTSSPTPTLNTVANCTAALTPNNTNGAAAISGLAGLTNGVTDQCLTVRPTVTLNKITTGNPIDAGWFLLVVDTASVANAACGTGCTSFIPSPPVQSGGSTGQVIVDPGKSITLSEWAWGATGLNNYTPSISCVDGNGTAVVTGGSGYDRSLTTPSGTLADANAGKLSCTFTNASTLIAPPTPPTLSCASGGQAFDTGRFTMSAGGYGLRDARWSVAYAPTGGMALPGPTVTPPASGYYPAYVIAGAGPWGQTPAAGTAWISSQSGASSGPANSHTWYKLEFNLDPSVDPSDVVLTLGINSDNWLPAAWVNGVQQGASPVQLGWGTANTVTVSFGANWKTGANSLIFQVNDVGGSVAFLANASVSVQAICKPKLTLTKQTQGGFGGPFTFTGNNGWASQSITTTAAGAPGVTGAAQRLDLTAVSADTTLTESTALTGYVLTAVSCSGLSGGATPILAGNAFTIPFAGLNTLSAPGGINAVCTVTNAMPSTLSKAFAPSSISVGGTSTLTFTLANSAGSPAQSGLAFTDTLPAGLRVAATPNASTTCTGGTVTAAAGGNSIALAGGGMASGTASCTVTVDVTTSATPTPNTPATCTAALTPQNTNGPSAISGLSANLSNGVTDQCLTVLAPQTWWDGDAGPFDNGVINGGPGTWENANTRWTNSTGAINGVWDVGQVAHFTGTAATVNVSGTQNISGLDFLSQGYVLTGGVLNGVAATNTVNYNNWAAGTPQVTIDSVLASSGGGYRFSYMGPTASRGFVLTQNATYTGPTELTCVGSTDFSSLLQLGVVGGTTGDIASTSALIGGVQGSGCRSILQIRRSGTVNLNYPVSGALDFVVDGGATVNINNANTHSGNHTFYGWNASLIPTVNANASNSLGMVAGLDMGLGAKLNFAVGVSQALTFMQILDSGTTVTLYPGAEIRYLPSNGDSGFIGMNYAAFGRRTTLAGSGTLDWSNSSTDTVTINDQATVSPGIGGVGTLNIKVAAGQKVNLDGILAIELAAPGTNDKLAVTGDIDLSGGTSTLTLSALSGYNPAADYLIITYTGSLTGTFGANNLAAVGYLGYIDYSKPGEIWLRVPPRVKITKLSQGDVGTFGFAMTGLSTASVNLTTTVQGAPGISSPVYTGTSNAVVTIAETPPAGWPANPASVSCLDANAAYTGNPVGNLGTLSGATVTLAAGVMKNGADVTCTFTNQKASTLTGSVFLDNGNASGIANNGIKDGGELPLAGVNVVASDCAATTYGSAVTDGSGNYSIAITTTLAAGSPLCVTQSNLANHLSTGANAGGTALATPQTVGGTLYAYDRATDRISFTWNGTGHAALNFGDVQVNSFTASGAKNGVPNSTVIYPHIYTANSAGTVVFSTTAVSTPTLSGWTEKIFADPGCTGSLQPGATQLFPPLGGGQAVVAGQNVCIIVQQFIPTGANGDKNDVTVLAAFTYTNAAPALSASLVLHDVTTIGSGALELKKEVRNLTQGGSFGTANQAKSGDVLEYRITYINNATGAINNLVLNDTTPAYSTFVAASEGTTGAGLSGCAKNTPVNPSPAAGVSCAAVQTVVAPNNTGAVSWKFNGALPPGGTGNVVFSVKVD